MSGAAIVAPETPSRTARPPTGGLGGFVLLLFAWQTVLFLALLNGAVGADAFVLVHVGGCGALACSLRWRRAAAPRPESRSAARQAVAWCLFAGPFGAFVAFALALPPAAEGSADPVGDEPDPRCASRPDRHCLEDARNALLDRRLRLEDARHVRPLADIVSEGAQAEKLEALGVVYRKFDAALSAVLKQALRDPDASVRVLAATVMAKLHATFSRTIADRRAEAEETPDAAQCWRRLADARLAYADSRMLDRSRACAEIEAAVNDLACARALDPADGTIAARLDEVRRRLSAPRV